jgi:hypothetical protein
MPFLLLDALLACLTAPLRPRCWLMVMQEGVTRLARARMEARAMNLHAYLAGEFD